MIALVTGVSGFIGSNIAKELINRGHTVLGIVHNYSEFFHEGIEVVIADLTDINAINVALKNRKFDVVIDVAAKIPNETSQEIDYFDNILMTRNLLQFLKTNKPLYFVKISTIDVYNINGIIKETTPLGPENYYSFSKLVSEQLVEFFSKKYDVLIGVLRLTQIYGIGDNSNKFIPSIIKNIRNHSRVIIHGDGSDKRDFLYVKDVARIVVDCCEKRNQGLLNLATGESHSLIDVVNILKMLGNNDFKIEYQIRKKEKKDYKLDISNLILALGDVRTISLFDGLHELYKSEILLINR